MKILMRSIDLETSGLEPPASVIEIGWVDILFDTETKACEISAPGCTLFRPNVPLTPANIAVHHLTNESLAGLPLCHVSDLEATATLEAPKFLVAANAAFERQWFTDDLIGAARWICTVKAAAHLYPEAESHSNQAMRYELGLDLDEALAMPPHRAGPDAYVTARILAEFLKTTSVKQLVQWQIDPRHYSTMPIGKHRGSKWADCPADYLQWMTRQADMDADLVSAAIGELQRRRGDPA